MFWRRRGGLTDAGAGGGRGTTLAGFRDFMLRGNVVSLAIGIVFGVDFTSVVNALIGNVVTPLIPLPTGSLAELAWTPPYGHTPVMFGLFINALITLALTAVVVYFLVVKPVNKITARFTPPANTKACPYCKTEIPGDAIRCKTCGTWLDEEAWD